MSDAGVTIWPHLRHSLLCFVCVPLSDPIEGDGVANPFELLTITERDESVSSRGLGLRKRRPEYGELTRRPRVLGRGLRAAFGQRFRWLWAWGLVLKML